MPRIYTLMILVLASCTSTTTNDLGYKIAYKNDREGNTLTGSKEDLINFIRGGADIKIGWGVKGTSHSIEHLSSPIWIAVLDETEVIAHLDPQVLSKINWDELSADYSDTTLLPAEWRVVITTEGQFDAVWFNRIDGTIIERRPQNHTMTWFVKGQSTSVPLFSNE